MHLPVALRNSLGDVSEYALGLGLSSEDAPQLCEDFDAMKSKFSTIFESKTQQEWCTIFDHVDACVSPVISRDDAVDYKHNEDRHSFMKVTDIGLIFGWYHNFQNIRTGIHLNQK